MATRQNGSRTLVAASPRVIEEWWTSFVFLCAFFVIAAAFLAGRSAHAETPPPPVGFVPGEFNGGTEMAPAGHYYFPDGWKAPPANSSVATDERFPQVTAKVRCTVKVTGGSVSVTCPGLERSVMGRWKGAVGLTTWPETVGTSETPIVVTTKLGIFVYFETVSVAGHVYHSSVSASPAGHTKEMVFTCEPGGSAEVAFDVQFVHQDQDVVAKPPTPAKK